LTKLHSFPGILYAILKNNLDICETCGLTLQVLLFLTVALENLLEFLLQGSKIIELLSLSS